MYMNYVCKYMNYVRKYMYAQLCTYVFFLCTIFSLLQGLECDTFDNPADFFLDKVSEAEEDLNSSSLASNIA